MQRLRRAAWRSTAVATGGAFIGGVAVFGVQHGLTLISARYPPLVQAMSCEASRGGTPRGGTLGAGVPGDGAQVADGLLLGAAARRDAAAGGAAAAGGCHRGNRAGRHQPELRQGRPDRAGPRLQPRGVPAAAGRDLPLRDLRGDPRRQYLGRPHRRSGVARGAGGGEALRPAPRPAGWRGGGDDSGRTALLDGARIALRLEGKGLVLEAVRCTDRRRAAPAVGVDARERP